MTNGDVEEGRVLCGCMYKLQFKQVNFIVYKTIGSVLMNESCENFAFENFSMSRENGTIYVRFLISIPFVCSDLLLASGSETAFFLYNSEIWPKSVGCKIVDLRSRMPSLYPGACGFGDMRSRFLYIRDMPQSRSQSFVPLDQRSENESSGSNHFRHAP